MLTSSIDILTNFKKSGTFHVGKQTDVQSLPDLSPFTPPWSASQANLVEDNNEDYLLYLAKRVKHKETMAPTETEINALLSGDACSADTVPKFEEYVTAQVAGQVPYHADAVRRLIKLYQFFPQTSKPEKVAEALFLALLQFPSPTDFLALKYMIPTTTMNQEPCDSVKTCFQQLEACQFTQFWESYASLQSSPLASALNAGTVETFQMAILQVLPLTYKEAPASVVLRAIKADSIDTVKALNHAAVESVSNDAVVFVSTGDNTKRQRVYQESLNFESISQLMSTLSQ